MLTKKQAQAEAKRRWGKRAYAKISANGLYDVGLHSTFPDGSPLNSIYGWSRTSFEEAFNLADAGMYRKISEETNK